MKNPITATGGLILERAACPGGSVLLRAGVAGDLLVVVVAAGVADDVSVDGQG